MPNQVCSESRSFERIRPDQCYVEMSNPFREALSRENNFPETRSKVASPSPGDVDKFLKLYGSTSFTRQDLNSIVENHPDGNTRRTAGYFEKHFDQLTRLSATGGSTEKLTKEDLNLFNKLLSVNEKETPRAKQAVDYLKKNFRDIDKDGDGKVSQREIDGMSPEWGKETEQFKVTKKYLKENYSVLASQVRTGMLWNTASLITKDSLREGEGAVDKLVEHKFRKEHYDSELKNYSFIPVVSSVAGGLAAGQRTANFLEQNLLRPVYSTSGYRLDNPRRSMYLALAGIGAGVAGGNFGGSWLGTHVNEWWNAGNVQQHFNNHTIPATRGLFGTR